jgi:hypothetical protein
VPRVSPLHSQVAFHSQASGVLFNIAGMVEGFMRLAWAFVSFPARVLTLFRLSPFFVWQIALARDRQSHKHRADAQ